MTPMFTPPPDFPPFPRLGEIYRVLSGALGTKARNRTVDRLAREGEYDWSLLPSLATDLIVGPLHKYVDPEFSRFIQRAIARFHSHYLGLVSEVSLDSLSREETLPLLIQHYFCLFGADLLCGLQKEYGGPDLAALLDPDREALAVVLDWGSRGQPAPLAKMAFPASTNTDRTDREMVGRWARGPQLPDLANIKRFCDALAKHDSLGQRENLSCVRRWLLVARALVWLERASPIPLRATMHQHLLLGLPDTDIGQILSTAVHHAGQHFAALSMPVLLLHERLKRTSEKQSGDQAATRADLDDLLHLMTVHDPEGRTRFQLDWLLGRWHVLSGQAVAALPHYQEATRLASYRAGELQKRIVEEALVLAAYLETKPFLNQLKNRAIAFQLFADPRGTDVIEEWEIDHLRQQFHRVFPQQGRFVEATPVDGEPGQWPFLVWDQAELARLKPDLRKPNRVVSLHSHDGQVRRWPQLRLFASLGRDKEVAALLAHGASVDQLDEAGGSALLCALQHAATSDRTTLDLLLRHPHAKATLDSATTKKRLTPLMAAIDLGEPDVVERLLTLGASSERRMNIIDETPLYFCMERLGATLHPAKLHRHLHQRFQQNPDRVQQEVMRRYNVSLAGVFGDAPTFATLLQDGRNQVLFERLTIAMVNEQLGRNTVPKLVRIAELLLEAGADPNAAHDYPAKGRTPLMLAVENDCVEAVDLMMQHHGNPYQRDASGLDCCQIAIGFGAAAVVRYLRDKGVL